VGLTISIRKVRYTNRAHHEIACPCWAVLWARRAIEKGPADTRRLSGLRVFSLRRK